MPAGNGVPVFGTVRTVVYNDGDNEVSRSELVDFGECGGARKPMGSTEPVGTIKVVRYGKPLRTWEVILCRSYRPLPL